MSGHRVASDLAKGAPTLADPGNAGDIVITKQGQLVELESSAAETRTLKNPLRASMRATIRMKTDGGDITLTASNGLNVTGNNTAVFADVGDLIDLISVSHTSGYRWEILVNTGSVALSTV